MDVLLLPPRTPPVPLHSLSLTDDLLRLYPQIPTVARLKLACGERLAKCYNSDIIGLVEPGYSFAWLLTRPIPDTGSCSFLLRKLFSGVSLLIT